MWMMCDLPTFHQTYCGIVVDDVEGEIMIDQCFKAPMYSFSGSEGVHKE